MSKNIGANDVANKIRKLYSTSGYMAKHGNDLWISVILCIFFSIFISYFFYKNLFEVVRSDWDNQKCSPLVIPFAGFINPKAGQSNLEFTASNFNGCIKTFLRDIFIAAIAPFHLVLEMLTDLVNKIIESIKYYRELVRKLRNAYMSIFKELYQIVMNLMVYFQNFSIKIKDLMSKIQGILASILFTMFGSYLTLQSLMKNIIIMVKWILLYIVVILTALIAVAIILWFIPLLGLVLSKPVIVICLAGAAFMIAILIPAMGINVMLQRVMGLDAETLPGVPNCFAADTPIELVGAEAKTLIKDIKIGDILKNGSKVTAVLKLSAAEQHLYNLNGIIVSGEHRVFHPKMQWIKVKNHPESIYIPHFNEPYLYCLNTDKKSFTINETIYSDWDDIDEKVTAALNKNCVANGYLPENFTPTDIHKHLDSGFHRDSLIILQNGTSTPISEVKVNDVLASGDKVRGIIKIDARDMDVYNHSFSRGYSLCGSKNIHIDDNNLGIINCMSMRHGEKIKEDFLYHLLTDTSFFVVNNIRVNDYNSGIDAYLV